MLGTISLTGLSTVLQSLIDEADKDKVGGDKTGSHETRFLSISFTSNKKSTGIGYLIFSVKKGNQAAKKGGKGARSSKYLTLGTKKTFNLLWHMFIQALIFQHFDLKRHI